MSSRGHKRQSAALPTHAAAEERTQRPRLSRVAFKSADWTGSVEAAAILVALLMAWAIVGFESDFPRWWELVMTIGVPVVALLMLIVVQHTQSHANRATQLKLDELIWASARANNHMMTLEDASGSDLERIHAEFSDKLQQD